MKIFDKDSTIGNHSWLMRKKPPKMPKTKPIIIVDLFCGCGGFTLGAIEAALSQNLAIQIALAIDSDLDALQVYKQNFKATKITAEDICNIFPERLNEAMHISEERLRVETGHIDLLLAGPPCQGHSNLNNKTRRDDPRNQLYLKAIRGVEILRPSVAIIENVTAVKHDKSGVVRQSLEILKKIGYHLEIIEINASRYNVAQSRKRHFLIANSLETDVSLKRYMDNLKYKEIALENVISDLVDESKRKSTIFCTPSSSVKKNIDRINFLFENDLYDLPNDLRPNCHRYKSHSYVSMYGRMKWDCPAQTITSGFGSIGQGRFIHPLRARVITPHEAARIQGFPDYFDFSSTVSRSSLHRMIANAVPPPVSMIIISFFLKNFAKKLN